MDSNTSDLLGICIPTYKRPDQLSACVESIIRSIGNRKIPIILSDDSTDDTNVEVVARLRARYPHIIHDRNPVNLGIDRNILKSVDLCTCRYAWMIGEDDRMVPEAVPTVMNVLENASVELPFVYVNYASVDETLTLVLHEQSLPLKQDVRKPVEDFFQTEAWSIGFIGACVINRRLWTTAKREPYLDSYFAHVGMILESLNGQTIHLIAKPLVLNRCGTARIFTWTHSAFEVMSGWSRMTRALEPIYGEAACANSNDSMDAAHGTGTLLWYGYLRADRAFSLAAYHKHVHQSPHPPLHKFFARLIAITPPAFFQLIRWCLTHIRRRTCRTISGYET
jgi:glycosyltransferase involved in cell wall biosynthesis